MSHVYGSIDVGIYCLPPGCCSDPLKGARYPLAASAEAARMRACMTCRPYRLSPIVGRGAPELLCRAVRLIAGRALDQGTEPVLAARLGVSARHLRRLFLAHLGVTPDGLARSCRAHFARVLLDDTDLMVADVAFIAGYGSIRQFNREFLRIFRFTPSQVRSSRSSRTRLAADGGLTLRLWFTGSLDWDVLLDHLAGKAVPGVEHIDGQTYRRTVVVSGDPGVLELAPGGSDHLQLRVHLPHWESLIHVAARARQIASLDRDFAEPGRFLSGDLYLGPLVAARSGVRVPGAWDPFEVSVMAIIEQQMGPVPARAVMAKIVSRVGRPVAGLTAWRLTHVFPAPRVLAESGSFLQAAGMSADQAMRLVSFASGVEQGVIRLDGSMTFDELTGSISAVPGVTISTAHYIALRLGEPDAFPDDEPALRDSLRQLIGSNSLPVGHSWRPWRSYAAAHLWAAARDSPHGCPVIHDCRPKVCNAR
jgi:AraC family transcriptional regulator, regulatory protein of adaptative response / DNA-3-methyladenine glycosylase II